MAIGLIIISIALIFVAIGSIYALLSLMLWKDTNTSGIGVEVTKSRSFLHNNFLLSSIVGAFAGLHVLLEFLQFTVTIESTYLNRVFYVLYYITLLVIVIVLSILSFKWYTLLSKVNKWDKRWISGKK